MKGFLTTLIAMFALSTSLEVANAEKRPCFKIKGELLCQSRPDCVWYAPRSKCGDETLLAPADECLADSTKCTRYLGKIFQRDYPRRYTGKKKCYRESFDPLTKTQCDEVCDELFESNPQWGPKVQRACKIGCMYARNWHAKNRKRPTCMKQCKTTVWNRSEGNKRCNYNNGLGIDVWEIDYFGAGIACELGCLIGRERPCFDCPKITCKGQV